jgi:hypothetical protein
MNISEAALPLPLVDIKFDVFSITLQAIEM